MTEAVEAVLDPSGNVRLLEPMPVSRPTRVLVTVVPETMAEMYARAKEAVSTAELEAAAAQPGGRTWSEIRARMYPPFQHSQRP